MGIELWAKEAEQIPGQQMDNKNLAMLCQMEENKNKENVLKAARENAPLVMGKTGEGESFP